MDKNKRKIHPISNSIFGCAAGTSADCDQITRKASQYLSMVRIEKELASEVSALGRIADSVRTAVTHMSNTIRSKLSTPNGRKVQAVLILGGVDATGPSLYQIDAEGVPVRISFGALGSGSTDALAVLESARREWTRRPTASSETIRWAENVSVEEATAVVRRAVQSGILNDLGSGSHVDLCVITDKAVRLWRESLVSSWDADRVSVSKYTERSVTGSVDEYDTRSSDNMKLVVLPEAALGRRVFSAVRPRRRLNTEGQVEEAMEASPQDAMLGLNIDLIE
jgi:20S proteasome subunit beta 2